MHLYSILFLLAAYLKFSEACLVIRYSKPPACACKTLKLDSSNAKENEVKDNDLYELVLSSQIKSPEILIDDCFIQVYCEGESELYIFDIDKGAKIGDYSLDGFCDPYQQKWQVDTGNGMEQYKELKGVCVLKETATCLPTDPATLLFAYSNDLVYYPDVFMVMQVVMSTDEETRYKTAATVRFDTKTKGDIVFHEGATQNDSFSKAQAHVEEQKLDPSQSFDSLETGSDVLDMLEAMYNLPFHMYSDAYYSLNVKASGTGSMVLPPLNITKKLKNSYLVVGVQSTGTAQSFQSLTLSWENTELGISGSMTKTREDLDNDWSSSLNTFQKFDIKEVQPATYQLKLDYSYLTEDTILIRINSKTSADHWLSYQD